MDATRGEKGVYNSFTNSYTSILKSMGVNIMLDDYEGKIRFKVEQNLGWGGFDISGMIISGDKSSALKDIIVEDVSRGVAITPFAKISKEACVELMNELWRNGIRPTDTSSTLAGKEDAMQEHIDDLRKITFKTLKIEG